MYVFQLFDYYSGNKMIMVIAFLECFTVAYLYGNYKFLHHILKDHSINLPACNFQGKIHLSSLTCRC